MNGLRYFGVLLFAMQLMACASTEQARFYLLEAVAEPTAPVDQAEVDATIIELKLAKIPAYLDRPQMVTRQQDHQVRINQFQRWAEPLQDSIKRVLVANFNRQLARAEVRERQLLSKDKAEYRLLIQLLRFDSNSETGNGYLQARWLLQKSADKSEIMARTELLEVAVAHNDFASQVQGLSIALARLTETIANRIAPDL